MDYTFRRVRPSYEDAVALLSVEQQSLGDSPYTPAEAFAILRRPEHHAYIACQGTNAVGFLSCLETATPRGLRLELDLLGVLGEHRGRGIASSLLRMAIEDARGRGIRRFRGVVAEDNAPSQAAFRRAGLTAACAPALLLVYEVLGCQPVAFLPPQWNWLVEERPAPSVAGWCPETYQLWDERGVLLSRAHCQPVQTLSYRGLWIEEFRADPRAMAVALRGIVERAKLLDLDQAGRLVSDNLAQGDLEFWLRQGFRNLGPYVVFAMG